jgi:outer membrane biosynthesis protein TonB
MADDGFHEIQLNSKQLIFLCMTAALVLVVAFLSGVLVGRGVRTEKDASLLAAESVSAAASPADSTAAAPAAAEPPAPPPTAIAPPTPADEDLTYEKRLESKQPPKETLKPVTDPPPSQAPAKSATKEPPAAKVPATKEPAKTVAPAEAAKSKVDASLPAEPAGTGYYLKIVALRDRTQADSVARRLSGKGYSSYVVPMSGKGPVLYSVRVGKYKTRREADSIRRRLEKEEQYKPLISH